MELAFIIANIIILTSYAYVAFKIIPIFPVTSFTRVTAVIFFLLCGLGTHGDMLYHTLLANDESWEEIVNSVHMILIHVPQALAVVLFTYGFHRDMRRLARERKTVEPAAS